ncbi:coiled-coil-helix-coiled-coil-helix domain-containing protein 7 isoform X1 [Tamandua tetradactyla]|uniref:coiled-coil-helix-coiled-coil-helix domain-containing protein 7 isoform X1 n=2 Tax=Tamandua tetradactyla TaxID=48850 RepID=UPI004053E5C9
MNSCCKAAPGVCDTTKLIIFKEFLTDDDDKCGVEHTVMLVSFSLDILIFPLIEETGLADSCLRKKTARMPMVSQRLRDPDINPCLLESDASTRCLDENHYDREKCSTYFLKYKNCRKFWNSVMIQRRQKGVTPSMPTVAERDKILEAMGNMPY